jgi:hypothetical protein
LTQEVVIVVPQHPRAVEIRTDDVENAAEKGIWIAKMTNTITTGNRTAVRLIRNRLDSAHPLIIE